MSSLRIRLYNVLFGDAILVTVPRPHGNAHILFDVGNVLNKGGADDVFEPIVNDIIKETGGEVDLYVMTHEHLDHVQGLLHAKEKWGKSIKAKTVWITASAAPNYYDKHSDAQKKKKGLAQAYEKAERIMKARGAAYASFSSLLANNNSRDTEKCVEYLRTAVAKNKSDVHFISRESNGHVEQPIPTVKLEILAPEEDTSDYYGRGKPFAMGAIGEPADSGEADEASEIIAPPPGVDAGAFADLLKSREEGFLNSLLQIDKAANNTSVVLRMTWKGRTLLFPGDAENKSWAFMKKNGGLGAVDFLKLGHHGSHNGMPLDLLDTLLPKGGNAKRHVGLSTCLGCYNNVPLPSLLKQIGTRAEIYDTRKVKPGEHIDVSLSGLT